MSNKELFVSKTSTCCLNTIQKNFYLLCSTYKQHQAIVYGFQGVSCTLFDRHVYTTFGFLLAMACTVFWATLLPL